MRKRIAAIIAVWMAAALLASGCSGTPRSETIIIPETEGIQPANEDNSLFAVKTIYPLPTDSHGNVNTLVWMNADSLVALNSGQGSVFNLERIDYPYEASVKLQQVKVFSGSTSLSPDGSFAAAVMESGGSFSLELVLVADGKKTFVDTISDAQIRTLQTAWSLGGRYFCYFLHSVGDGGDRIVVYDTEGAVKAAYSVPQLKEQEQVNALHISDDGQSIALIKESANRNMLQYGSLDGGNFSIQYEHSISRDGWVEWLHDDQIVFADSDGTLYVYDRRNASLSVLLEQIGIFRLSQDRKYIAYSRNDDTIYAATLYGNNILNINQVYRGMLPSQMIWSPDNGKLLLSGWKSYPAASQRAREEPVVFSQNQVIAFK